MAKAICSKIAASHHRASGEALVRREKSADDIRDGRLARRHAVSASGLRYPVNRTFVAIRVHPL
jgi:hypothetical protein